MEGLSSRFPCRRLQIQTLFTLLHPLFPTPPAIVIHGLSATGKTCVINAVLESLQVRFAIVNSREEHATRFTDNQAAQPGQQRCDSLNTLAVHLEKTLKPIDKFVIVFDGVDRQRESSPTLIPGLVRLGAMIKNLIVVVIISVPNPRLLHASGVPHIHFPPYTKEESIQIVSNDPPLIFLKPVDASYDYGDEEEAEDRAWLWPRYCHVVWESTAKGAARDLRSFKLACHKLWRRFVQPIADGEFGTHDFSRLLVKQREIFRDQSILAGNSAITQGNQSKVVRKRNGTDDIPYYSKFILCAAYLASYNPPRHDQTYFMKSSERKRRKRGGIASGRASKSRKIPRHLLGPSTFSLNRLLAILHAIIPHSLQSTSQIYTQIATLTSLRLLLRVGSASVDMLDSGGKFRANYSWEYAARLGRSVGFEMRDYLAI